MTGLPVLLRLPYCGAVRQLPALHFDDLTEAAPCTMVHNEAAAALRRAVLGWQLLSGYVQAGRKNGSLGDGEATILGRTGVRSCQRHVNALMSLCECL